MNPSPDQIRSIYRGIESRPGLSVDMQGWNSEGPIVGDLIPRMRGHGPKIILDVGVWNGRSTIHMARLCQAHGIEATIYAIDVFFGLVPGAIGHLPDSQIPVPWNNPTRYEQFLFNVKAAGFDHCIIPVCNFTAWGARMLAHWGVKAHLIVVDAGHEEEFVYKDLCEYWPLLEEGGVMTGDDYSASYPGVQRAIERFCAEQAITHEVVGGHWKLSPKRTAAATPQPSTKKLLRGLSGYVPVRNGNKLDYCWQLAVKSMLPVCDEVVICDSDSDDGTHDEADAWAKREPKIRVINYPWPEPKGDVWMLLKWLNFARKELRYDMQITLDADEVIHPDAYAEIRRAVAERGCRWFRRMNFWRDAQSLVPDGQVCGMNVARLGPTEFEMPSDNAEAHPGGEPLIRVRGRYHPKLLIWHLGFLRRQDSFLAKSRVMQAALLNTYDPKLAEAEKTGQAWHELSNSHIKLVPYTGTHPEIVHDWLVERGYALQ